MQIQLREDSVWRCPGLLRESTAPNRARRRVAESSSVLGRDDVGKRQEEICWTRRHNERERAETREGFVMWIDVSCGDGIPGRRRTELELRSCKPFDDQHRLTTLRAQPSIARTGGGDLRLGLWCRAEPLKAKWQGGGTSAIGQEA